MTTTAELAEFARGVEYGALADGTVEALKRRVLDSVGVAVAAMGAGTTEAVRTTVVEQNAQGRCRLWGDDWAASPPDAAMYNTALTHHANLADAFLAPGGVSHPSDVLGSVVACAEADGRSGRDLLAALGAAYEVQGELAWNAPVRERGWDHATHTAVAAACGAGHVARLDREQLRAAVGSAGATHGTLGVVRSGDGASASVASASAARNAVYAVLLARNGTEGPRDLFEGRNGWKEVVAGDFDLSLSPGCERVFDAATRRHAVGAQAQSAVEGIVEVARERDLDPGRVERIRLSTVRDGVGEDGDGPGDARQPARAVRSVPHALAAALVERGPTAGAAGPESAGRDEVEALRGKVEIEADLALAGRVEAGEAPAIVDVELTDGTVHRVEKRRFSGHPDDPMGWEQVEAKFHACTRARYGEQRRADIVRTVRSLEDRRVRDLVELLD